MRVLALFFLLLLLPLTVRAETSIAVVDVQALLQESLAADSIEKQVGEQKDKFLSEVSEQEQKLSETEKELAEQRDKLSKDDFTAKAKKFENDLHETRRLTQAKKRALDDASATAQNALRDKISGIVQKIATERGYNLVITKQNVVVGDQSIDITDETMKRLNKELPDVKLDLKQE